MEINFFRVLKKTKVNSLGRSIDITSCLQCRQFLRMESLQSLTRLRSQVGYAELKETADYRANIGVTIIGAPIIGQ